MACVSPVDGWRAREANESGKFSVVFSSRGADFEEPLSIPCGKCIGCRQDRSRDWGVRCYHESLCYSRNAFVTLTYTEAPEKGSLYDLQCFFKRLRYAGYKVRYFACGEYGTLSGRFHYHALIFGEDFRDGSYSIDGNLYGSPLLDYIWGRGICSIGSVTPESCFYTAGYVLKKAGKESFSMMSRRPGIGRRYLDRYFSDMLNTGTCVVGGREYSVPRRYFDWAHLGLVQDRRKEFLRGLTPQQRWDLRVGLRAKEENISARLECIREKV